MGQSESSSIHGATEDGGERGKVESNAGDTERVLKWEVCIARACLDTFRSLLMVHAVIFTLLVVACFVGFLEQLHVDTGKSKAILVFSLTNSLALYTGIAGLLFTIYCLLTAIISFHDVPLPSSFDDPLSIELLHNLRAFLRHIALPGIRRRCKFLFASLAVSLLFCVIAHVSAGIASLDPEDRLIGVMLPAIPGCFVLLFLLMVGIWKMHLELDFDKRFRRLWARVAPHISYPPEVRPLDKDTAHAFDPLPRFLSQIRDV